MASYDYPFEDFLRDFSAISPPANAVAGDFGHSMSVFADYVRRTYPDPIDRSERGSTIGQALWTLSTHAAEFNSGDLAVRGSERLLSSEFLLRAVHQTILRDNQDPAHPEPNPAEIRALAEQFRREHQQQ